MKRKEKKKKKEEKLRVFIFNYQLRRGNNQVLIEENNTLNIYIYIIVEKSIYTNSLLLFHENVKCKKLKYNKNKI